MQGNFKQLMIDCLEIAARDKDWDPFVSDVIARHGWKAIKRKCEELGRKGYLEPGTMVLTEKGRAALALARSRRVVTHPAGQA